MAPKKRSVSCASRGNRRIRGDGRKSSRFDSVRHDRRVRRRLVREQDSPIAGGDDRAAVEATPRVPLFSPDFPPFERAVSPAQRARGARRAPHEVVLDVVLVETQERARRALHAHARRSVSRHVCELEMHDVVLASEHLLQRNPEHLLVVSQPFVAVLRPQRCELQEPLARATGVVRGVGHGHHLAAVLRGRARRRDLTLSGVDERQDRDVCLGRHTRDELVQPPLGAERGRTRQERRDEEDREPVHVLPHGSAKESAGRCRSSS